MKETGWVWLGLIDMVLQIAFCLLTITFTLAPREHSLDLRLPTGGRGAGTADATATATKRVMIEIDRDGRAVCNGATLEPARLDALLSGVALDGGTVDLRADRETRFDDVFAVLDRARTAGVTDIAVAYRGTR